MSASRNRLDPVYGISSDGESVCVATADTDAVQCKGGFAWAPDDLTDVKQLALGSSFA